MGKKMLKIADKNMKIDDKNKDIPKDQFAMTARLR